MRRAMMFIGIVCMLCGIQISSALADYNSSRNWFNRLSSADRTSLQLHLILTGHYVGFADARFGRNTYGALTGFEIEQGLHADGVLNRNEADRLLQVSGAFERRLDFRFVADKPTGIQLPIPAALLAKVSASEFGTVWQSSDGSFVLESIALSEKEVPFQLLFGLMASKMQLGTVTYQQFDNEQFVLSGEGEADKFYAIVNRNGQHNSGFVFRWTQQAETTAKRVAVYMATSIRTFPVTVQAATDPAPEGQPGQQGGTPRLGSGSGFFVSTNGLILTNFHVVRECAGIKVSNHGLAEVLRISTELDLAVLLVRQPKDQNTAIIRNTPPPLGSSIVAGGFPLSDIFDSQFTVAFGQVTGRRGLKGTENRFSMSVPVQPGNSGGPVVNEKGEVVGIAVAKLDDSVMMKVAGTTGANFSFAVDPAAAADFLRPFVVEMRNDRLDVEAGKPRMNLTNEERVANMETYTVQILCELAR